MNLCHAIIFGIVEGISEFLPISSTGHLILTAQLLNIAQSDFIKSFQIIIQLGAICSVVVLYFKSLVTDIPTIKKIMAALIPTLVIGFIFYKLVKRLLLGNSHVVIWSLLIGGICLIVFELLHRERADATDSVEKISYRQAVIIGLFQSIAIIPGVSRSAATILGGLLLGLKRRTIVEFSFLLAVPTMLAATVLDLSKNLNAFSGDQFLFLLTGFVTSFIVALFAIKFLLNFINKHSFIAFGVYRIIIALLFFFLVL
ncbi:MAG TPA: undecaprenyl-diphosphate phosphatase [Candidatus Bathyarchaeia archaeon]|nr:undecaprenyl-diphosphate phosphatase [Candidatus Bathyarchaeia archaeon]